MNGNDLMNALSGLDPKFIDEAAYELHDMSDVVEKSEAAGNADEPGKGKVVGFRKFIYIALPSVAAILLIVGVAFPAIMRVSKSESAAPMMENAAPAADEAAAEAADEAVAEAPAEEPVAEAAAEAAPEEAAGEAATYDAADDIGTEPSTDKKQTLKPDIRETAKNEEAEAAADTAGETDAAPAMEEAAPAEEAAEAEEAVESEEAEDKAVGLVIDEAKFAKGTLTLKISGMTADDITDMECKIEKTMAGRSVVTYEAGKVSDIMKSPAPLTLDVSSLNLTSGTYMVTVGTAQAEFEIP